MRKLGIILVLAVLVSAGASEASSTLTFDELSYQPVDGLSYEGVTFGFAVGDSLSTKAYYGASGPRALTYLQGKALVGNTRGILTLDFASPITDLQFGVALKTKKGVRNAYRVELFDKSLTSLGTFAACTKPLACWSEGQFKYSGTAISRAVVDLNERHAGRFAIDNLTSSYIATGDSTPTPGSVPAPGAILLGSIGAGLVSWLRRRKTLL